ncbi:translocation/assembly module TamB domain-containing protein [Ancylothrix sp. C2]|uniref:translocation/assembly module TamB n=1 Tax=Ancylothrix sp. D3o TaxID=2953691 RepID=UPI0021BA8F14|nr:translocation/assembly module TamB [Ancylothrix sp. D3o]MCT7949536.1 translocation/assembly module TamB domain-containing protein [Ancylothrix sp. D3o]
MTNSPNSSNNQPQERPNRPNWRRRLKFTGIGLGVAATAGVTAGGIYGWNFVNNDLAPLVERELTQTLKRPVQLGKVEDFTYNGLRFGPSALPATPTDPDRATVEAVDINFNLLQLITTRKLILDITLINPNAYIEQEQNGEWVQIPKPEEKEDSGVIKTEVDTLKLQNATVVLLPASLSPNNPQTANLPIRLFSVNGQLQLREQNQLYLYQVEGKPAAGGSFAIQGETLLPNRPTNLKVNAQDFLALDLYRLLARTVKLPIALNSGKVDGNLDIRIRPQEQAEIRGTARVKSVVAKINPLPKLLSETNGNLEFLGNDINVRNITTIYGKVPAVANGLISLRSNSNLGIVVRPVNVSDALETIDVKIPFTTAGNVQLDILVKGPITEPIVVGNVRTPDNNQSKEPPLKIDRVDLAKLSANFQFTKGLVELKDIEATPNAGGKITSSGTIRLASQDRPTSLSFGFNATQLPGNFYGPVYGVSPDIRIGTVSATGEIVGPADKLQTTVNWQAPEAIFPATGKVIIAGDTILLRDTLATVAGGTATLSGQLVGRQWSATIEPLGLKLSQLAQLANREFIEDPNAKISNTNIPGQIISGRLQLSGNTAASSPENITADGNLLVSVAQGAASIKTEISNGQLQAIVEPVGLELSELAELANSFSPPGQQLPISAPEIASLPVEFLGGDVTFSAPINNISADTISGSTNVQLKVAGGDTTITGTLENGQWQAAVQGSQIQVGQLVAIPANVPTGPATVQATLSGTTNNLTNDAIRVNGAARVAVAGGSVDVRDLRVAEGRWAATVEANDIQPAFAVSVASVSEQLGRFNGNFEVSGSTQEVNVNNIRVNGSGNLAVADGRANVTVNSQEGQILASVEAVEVPVSPFVGGNVNVPSSLLGRFNGNFDVALKAPENEEINLTEVAINGSGRLGVGQGAADVTVSTTGNRWQATVAAAGLPVQPLLPAQVGEIASEIGNFTGNFTFAGLTNNFDLAGIRGSGSGNLGLAGGTITANNVQLNGGRWQATVEPENVKISRFSNQLKGELDGNLNVGGSLSELSLAGIRAEGRVRLSEGVAFLNDPLSSVIAWDGRRLQIKEAKSAQLNASGVIDINTQNSAGLQINNFDLNVEAQKLNIADLAKYGLSFNNSNQGVSLPLIAGQTDFNGKISGSLNAPKLAGNVQVYNLVVDQINFEPVLAGRVNVAPGSVVDVDLRGNNDRIALNLDRNYLPTNVLVRSGEVLASATRNDNRLRLNLEQFPINALKLTAPAIAGPGYVSGEISANLDLNLGNALSCRSIDCAVQNLQGGGKVAIANPRVGYVKADNFTGEVAVRNGMATLDGGSLKQGETEYLLSGRVGLGANPQYQASVQIKQGQLQQVLTSLQIFRLEDFQRGIKPPEYAKGEEVRPTGVSVQNQDILNQLRRFAEIQALLEKQKTAREEASPLPDLADLRGAFSGEISVNGSLAGGLQAANFRVQGQDWNWGRYTVDQALVEGRYQDGVVTLLPLRLQRADGVFAFAGTLGGERQSGQLQIENFPIEPLQELAEKLGGDLPLDVTGKLNAKATIGGSVFNPQVVGEVALVEGSLNQTPVQKAQASFALSDLRLNFGSTVLVSGPEPIQAVGSVPLLPLPGRDQITLALNVQNEALAVLNVLTNQQLQWVSGKGQVQVKVEGTLREPLATGVAVFEDAVMQAKLLPEPLTNVTGRVVFNRDRIAVEGIKGRFSEGEVVAQGVLPIFAPLGGNDPDRGNSLRVSLDRLAVNLKGLYRGGVTGLVGIAGTAFRPQIGGRIELSNGQVLLAEAVANRATGTAAAGRDVAAEDQGRFEVGFNNLLLVLGDNIAISQVPLFNFLAAGNLRINGPLYELQPAGTIRLTRGEVNLFTTQFRLAGGYEQTATFVPNRGLDPLLDVRLIALVNEVTGSRVPTSAFSNEIADNPITAFGSSQTVRIQARVEGPASQLFNSLELTSSPGRSESEIVALLGGGFVNTLGRGDSSLALANLAGSALLSPIESALSRALGLTEFRLFPTVGTNDGRRTSTLGLAAEAGIDITQSLSASVLRILTDNQPTQFGLRYRLNEQTLLRGSTDFSGDSRATVEYELRF